MSFQNGQDIYICQPKGFKIKDNEHTVCTLKNSLYDLIQASRQGFLRLNEVVISFSFKENVVCQCTHLKVSRSKFIIAILYVDDILISNNDIGVIHAI